MHVVLEAVQQYSTVVDTASSAHPIAALVWSSIKIVIQVIAPSVSRVLFVKQCSGRPEFRELFREIVQTLCAIECLLSSVERVREAVQGVYTASNLSIQFLCCYCQVLCQSTGSYTGERCELSSGNGLKTEH